MKDVYNTPDDKFRAVNNLRNSLEDDFIKLGEVLAEIKHSKLFKYKGYEKFREFVEGEYSMSSSLVNKIIKVYQLVVLDMDMDEGTIAEIGFDRLQMIVPAVSNASWEERERWIKMAAETPTGELRQYIKETKQKDKDTGKDLKQVFVEQYHDKMLSWFNCSKKELEFKLALYFQDADMDAIKKAVKGKQRSFEEDLAAPYGQTEIPEA